MIDPDRVPAATFALEDQLAPGPGAWHVHQRHQLLYARDGTLHLEVEDASWMLPPQRAAWIDGGARHRVRLGRPATLNTVYLDPSVAPALGFGCRVFAVGELAVTMLRASVRWGPERDPADPLADAWFAALAGLAREWAGAAMQTRLPRPKSAGLVRVFDHLLARVDEDEPAARLARLGGMSERTLHRRLRDECDTTLRELRQQARMQRAMELLLLPESSVTEVCAAVGYRSLGSFSAAFREVAGESPSVWRRGASGAS